MNMNRTERNRIKTDRAWSKLYQRLEEDRLIPAKEDKKLRMSPLWKWGAVAAALLAALVYAGVRYFSEVKTPVLYSLVVQQNKETSYRRLSSIISQRLAFFSNGNFSTMHLPNWKKQRSWPSHTKTIHSSF